jgi:hypothetical protein
VPSTTLPDHADIDKLKNNAKVLRDLVRANAAGAVELVREHHPRFPDLRPNSLQTASFKLSDAQLTLARHYRYDSWPQLRRHIDLVRALTRSPHEQPVGGPLTDDRSRADEFLRLACLTYGDDSAGRRVEAARLLSDHPHIADHSIHTAAATGNVPAAARHLAADADVARQEGGPYRWQPLLYVTYSRLPVDSPMPVDFVGVARLLLEHGADPNNGYLWDGLPSPFTALTGVFGGGEQGAPPHRDELSLARLLLQAGAEANDSQTIYNRGLGGQRHDDTAFLELLLDHGLGRGDGGPWRRALPVEHQSPAEIAAEALQFAAEAGLVQRVRLLLDRGIDPNVAGTHPSYRGRSPYRGAVLHGNLQIAQLLHAAGATGELDDPLDLFIGALLADDRAGVAAAIAQDAALLPRALADHPRLVITAAELGRSGSIELLAASGFDVDHLDRSTAMHEAAYRGDIEVVRQLIELGADPSIEDGEFHSTPRGWAEHNGQRAVLDYFDSLPDR